MLGDGKELLPDTGRWEEELEKKLGAEQEGPPGCWLDIFLHSLAKKASMEQIGKAGWAVALGGHPTQCLCEMQLTVLASDPA